MQRRPKILLVDDDFDLVTVMKGALESEAYEVIVAYDGKEGMEKAKKEKPDLIVLDIVMPGADGFTFADQFRKDSSLSKTPVLVLTSFSEVLGQPDPSGVEEHLRIAFEFAEYIRKPLKPKDLVAKVKQFLMRAGSQHSPI
jgi:two-component system alkaline phosphatase synthesis response regulator PhoP